jgi:hypothetical protein
MQLLIQFMCQGFGLMYYRYLVHIDDQEEAPFSVPLFPIPCIIQLTIFGFIFCTTKTYVFHSESPLLEVALAFIGAGVVCYLLWARQNGFWPYAEEQLDSDEEGLDHMVVYVADDKFDDEYAVLKKRLESKNKEIERLMKIEEESADVLSNRAADLDHVKKSLDQKDYKILQMTKKYELQEQKLHSLLGQLTDKEKEVSAALQRNSELRRELVKQQKLHGIPPDDSSDYLVEDDDEAEGVLGWGVAEVSDWWKKYLPKGAQKFVPMVEECHLTGKDLIELDKEMLGQLGIQKILVMKILKEIDLLRAEANLPPRAGSYHSERGSKSAERRQEFESARRSRSRGDYGQESEQTGPAWWDNQNTDTNDRVGITSV